VKHDRKETVEVFMGGNFGPPPPTDVTDQLNYPSQTLPTGRIMLTDVTDRLNDPVTEVTDRLNDPFTDAVEKMNDTLQTLTITEIPPYRGHRHSKRLLIQKSDL